MTVGYSLQEFSLMGGYFLSMIDIAPDFIGILNGVRQTFGFIPSFILPMAISTMTPNVDN